MNIFQQFYKSLYSPNTVSKFRFQTIGKTILYVFFFMLLVTIPPSFILVSSVNNFFNLADKHITEDIPDFTIANGSLSADITQPLLIDEGSYTIILDPSGELHPNSLPDSEMIIGLFEREAVLITGTLQQSIPYQEYNINFTKETAIEFLDNVIGILPIILGILVISIYLFATGMKFIGIFTLSFVAILLNSKLSNNLRYRHFWVLAAYSATLPTVLMTISDTLGFNIPFHSGVYWGIAIVMLYLVLREVPTRKET